MNVLVVAPNWIGDAIMAQPFLRLLAYRLPGARITALAPPHVAPVLDAMPEVERVIVEDFQHGSLQWGKRLATARRLRTQAFARAYVLPNSLKSALVPWLARIPLRIGYAGEARVGLLNRRLPNPPEGARAPMVEFYAALAAERGLPVPKLDAMGTDRPRLLLDEAAVAIAKAKFVGGARLAIGFCPGAEYGPAKRWPTRHFARLAELIVERHPNASIVCIGGTKDRAIADEIVAGSRADVLNLCGQTKLDEALALMKSMRAIVTNDSGLMHAAAALDVPLVALYGSTDPTHTPPHHRLARIERIDIACSPCFKRTCPLGHFRCMNDLAPERIAQALEPLLDASYAGPGTRTTSP